MDVGIEDDLNSRERLRWEKKLLGRARNRDSAALAELYNAYSQLIFSRVLLPKLGDRTAAEDALAETFRTAIERLDQFEARKTSIYFWIARIASNKATDMYRAQSVTGRALVNLEGQLGTLLESPLTPEGALESKNQYQGVQKRLRESLAQLNPRYRRAVELRFFQELSRERCAELMEVKLGTFDVLVLRALKSLRKFWEQAQTSDKEDFCVKPG